MSRLFVVLGIFASCFLGALDAYAGPREDFLQSEIKFINFQNPDPENTLSADARSNLKAIFLTVYNRTLALVIRLDHIANRLENAIGTRDLSNDTDQLRTRLAYARTRLMEARAALGSIEDDFEKILSVDPRTTLRSRAAKIRARFEREVAAPLRGAHATLVGITLKLKEGQ